MNAFISQSNAHKNENRINLIIGEELKYRIRKIKKSLYLQKRCKTSITNSFVDYRTDKIKNIAPNLQFPFY